MCIRSRKTEYTHVRGQRGRQGGRAICFGSIFLLLLTRTAVSLTMDLSYDNTWYARGDRPDSLTRNAFYNDVRLGFSNPGASGLSLYSDIGFTNDRIPGIPNRFDVRNLLLSWDDIVKGLDLDLGRQLTHSFAREVNYLDGFSFRFNGTRRFSFSGFGGLETPSRYDDVFMSRGPQALEAGLTANFRLGTGTILGAGLATDADAHDSRQMHIAGNFSTRIGRNLNVRGHIHYETAHDSLESFALCARYSIREGLMAGARFSGEGRVVDSVNYYERLYLKKYRETSFFFSLFPFKDLSIDADYALRFFEEGSDHFAGCNVAFRGASLRAAFGGGIHGPSIDFVPGYTFTYRRLLAAGTVARISRFQTTDRDAWLKVFTLSIFSRWFVPAFTPTFDLSIEPEVEYLASDYFKHDFRILLTSRLNLHWFRQSGLEAHE